MYIPCLYYSLVRRNKNSLHSIDVTKANKTKKKYKTSSLKSKTKDPTPPDIIRHKRYKSSS